MAEKAPQDGARLLDERDRTAVPRGISLRSRKFRCSIDRLGGRDGGSRTPEEIVHELWLRHLAPLASDHTDGPDASAGDGGIASEAPDSSPGKA